MNSSHKKVLAQVSVGVLVVFVYFGITWYGKKQNSIATTDNSTTSTTQTNTVDTSTQAPATSTNSTTADNTVPTTTPVPTPAPKPVANSSGYKDGTYTVTASYRTPERNEDLTVTLTLKNGVVVDSKVTAQAKDPSSKLYQSEFIQNYKQFVTGKNIDTLSLTRVAGSSLTPNGFNAAVAQIKIQAQS